MVHPLLGYLPCFGCVHCVITPFLTACTALWIPSFLIFPRRQQLNPVCRKKLLTFCPAILEALRNVLTTTAASASAVNVTSAPASLSCEDAKDTSPNDKKEEKDTSSKDRKGEKDTEDSARESSKTTPNPTATSTPMLKAKRLKPLLGCLSASIKVIAEDSAENDSESLLPTLYREATALRGALLAIGEASASLHMQRLCESVAGELDVLGGGDGDVKLEISQSLGEVDEAARDEEKSAKKKAKSKSKVKKRRESDAAAEEVGGADADGGSLKKKRKKKRDSAEGPGDGKLDPLKK